MIKARVLSVTMSTKPDAPIEMGMEMYVPDDTGFLSCPATVFIMKEEEYKALDSVSDILRKNLLDEREKTRELKDENEKLKRENNEKEGEICKLIVANKDLEEKLAQEAAEVYLCPDGTLVFRTKKVSELEKKVKKLEEENKALKEDKFTMKITGGLFYKED